MCAGLTILVKPVFFLQKKELPFVKGADLLFFAKFYRKSSEENCKE